MKRCIYCMEYKPPEAFRGREHVLQDAFGRYENAFTLFCVCDSCNRDFGNGIDLRLARDSLEGTLRCDYQDKAPADYKHLGPRSTIRMYVREGPFKGTRLYLRPNASGDDLEVFMEPQVGIGLSAESPHDFYSPDDLPTAREYSAARALPKGTTLHARLVLITLEDGLHLLEEKGYRNAGEAADRAELRGKVEIELKGVVDHEIMRAVAKIAFNYLAKHYTTAAFLPQFNPMRRYIRYGEDPGFEPVALTGASIGGQERVNERHPFGHVITVHWAESGVLAHVSLYGLFQYRVCLSNDRFFVVQPSIGHFYRWLDRKIVEVPLRKFLTQSFTNRLVR